MTDRWARAEELFRQREADRRYRRDDRAWGEYDGDRYDDYDDDTTVIPRYVDDEEEPEPAPPPPPPRRGGQRPRAARAEAPRRSKRADSERAESKRAKPERSGRSQRGKRSRVASRKAAERKKRRRTLWVVAGVFVLLFAGAVVFAGMKFIGSLAPPKDFAGPGGPLVVVQVHPGDTSQQIAATMVERGVVASTGAFFQAAVRNSNMNSVQPGFYAIPSQSPAAEAVATLVSKQSRVGNLVVSEGRLLHDQHDMNTGGRYDGIYRKIAEASCIGTGANQKCVTYEQLDAAGASLDLAALGVPAWAMQGVKDCPDRTRQLEGLIAAGTWDFDPSATPQEILRQLVTASAKSYESTGLLQSGADTKLTPYQTLVAASLVEREAQPQDMGKVARVIVNRLRADQMLQFDSTVNYALDRTEVATTDADRAQETAWNTYAMRGLPKTPIAAPSLNALRAMENPEAGPWLYFVTVDKQGTTLFTDDYQEHLRLIARAQRSGILDSSKDSGGR
ncbi:endolytic transglycosylase MltG [Nocardia implantans]|uniref:Endolytic murein transglycosylase n=1 Tax=Nocardia implantans TaxID=3108168 RepID=A0ABU6B102_9NOCA|nr:MULTISPECIES: endolytic transglycosylase MltG [unclassified Nocardia]MBF6195241.1 endolytic transglycosylase MltG [Nocardia beijingensis]MEA3530712.1 endolytic transglycosylase MltG [Nocardia sp. CDC192]MEB3513158.1 endolytic transglycosylase MltG [Nocardia sp. CDC186]